MTYGLFEELVKRHQARERKEFIRTGILASAVINFSMSRPDDPVDVMDFVPGGKEEKDLRNLSPQEQAEYVMNQMSKKRIRQVT